MIFKTPDEYYQAIGGELDRIVKEPWNNIEVEVILDESSVDIKVAYFRIDGSRETDVDLIMLPEYFYELARVVSTKEKGLYKKCYFVLKNDGSFNVDFEY